MRPFINRRNISVCILAIAAAACSETVTSPVNSDQVSVVSSRASAKGIDASARALRSASGVTSVEVTLGGFSTLSPEGNIIPGSPGVGYFHKVRVRFCKDYYKDFGLHQFTANFNYKAPNGSDKDTDKDTDKDDKADSDKHPQQVNWDRSKHFTALDGTGYAKIAFTGIPAGTSLEIQVQYRKDVVKSDGKVETKTYEEKFCAEVENTPQLSLQRVEGTQVGLTGLTSEYRGLINVSSGADAVVLAQCNVTVDGVVVGTTPAVAVSSTVGAWCKKTLTFPTVGVHQVAFSLVSSEGPSVAGGPDIDPANVSKNISVTIGSNGGSGGSGGSDGGGSTGPGPIVFELNPNVVETVDSTVVSDTAVYGPNDRRHLATATTAYFDQSSRINGVIKRIFTGPVRLIFKQTTLKPTGVYEISSVDYTVPTGSMCTPLTVLQPRAYDISFCPNASTGETVITYRTRATASYRTSYGYLPQTGTFSSYGSTMTYDLTLEYQGYRYHLDKSATEPNINVNIVSQVQLPWGATGTSTCSAKVGYQLCNSSYEMIRTKNSVDLPVLLLVTPTLIQ